MRIHTGELSDAFVLEVDLGNKPVWEVDYGETKIYPDEGTRIEAVVVDVTESPWLQVGTDEWIYWIHAMDATRKESNSKCNMKVEVGGKKYSLNAEVDGLPRCFFDERTGIVRFGELDGPVLQDVVGGGIIKFLGHIPERSVTMVKPGQDGANVTYEQFLPMLPDMRFEVQWNKGQKKKSAGINFWLRGLPSKHLHCEGGGQKNGHGRGLQTGWARMKDGAFALVNGGYFNVADNDHFDGDTGWEMEMANRQSCSQYQIKSFYPAFDKEWDMKVVGVLYTQADR